MQEPKKVKTLKMIIKAGQANNSLAPILGQAKIKIKNFCDDFNNRTSKMTGPLSVNIGVFANGEYNFESIRSESVVSRIKSKLNLSIASKHPGKEIAGQITKSELRKIALEKIYDFNLGLENGQVPGEDLIEKAMRICEGSARSAGIKVVEG